MIVGVISDTHMPSRGKEIPDGLAERLRRVDLILHAGDITTLGVLRQFERLAPVLAVSGNVDDAAVRQLLPATRTVAIEKFNIGLVHGDGAGPSTIERARRAFAEVDCIVFGHSHTPTVEIYRSTLMVNPGSPTDPRRQPRPSYAVLTVGETIQAEIVYL